MGITGLLGILSSITKDVHLSDYAGQRIAVDAYCWLHRGAYACSAELCQDIPTDKYIRFCMSRIKLMRDNNIIPVLVFDGGALPNKRIQEEQRRQRRKENRKAALEHLRKGNANEAREYWKKAVDITPKLAHNLIKVLKSQNIEYFVAPYEADAQLAFLSHSGYVDGIITEDSDMLPYGCKRVMFKMNRDGMGKEIRFENLARTTSIDISDFTLPMFRQMCILSGCDYLNSIPGFGIKKAFNLLKKYRTLDRVFRYIKGDGSLNVPIGYESGFTKAEQTFLHQRVFDPLTQKVIPLTPFPEDLCESEMDFVGPPIDDDLAPKIAYGYVDPYTYEPFETPKPQIPVTGLRTSNSGNTSNPLQNSFNQSLNQSTRTSSSNTININTNTNTTSTTTTTTRLSSGSRLSGSGSGLRKRKPIELDVQKNKISEYFSTPAKISGLVSKPFVPPRSSSQDSSYSYSYSSSSSQSQSQSQSSQSQSSQSSPSSTKKRKREDPEEEADEEAEMDQTDDGVEVLVARTPPKKILKRSLSSGPVQVVVKSRFFSPSSSSAPHLPGSPSLNRSSSSSSTCSTICEEKKVQKLEREDSFSDVICVSSSTSTSTSSSFDCNNSFSNTTPNTSTNNHTETVLESPTVIDLTVDIPADMTFSSPLVTPTRLTRIKTAMKKTPSTSSLHAYFAKKGFASTAKNVITSPYWQHS